MVMVYDIFTDRRISERRLADDVSDEVICRRQELERRCMQILSDSWLWWLRVDYVEREYRVDRSKPR